MSVKSEKPEVRQRNVVFADGVLTATDGFPQRYLCSLDDQLRRAVRSAPTHIAEGFGRDAAKESAYCCRIANGRSTKW